MTDRTSPPGPVRAPAREGQFTHLRLDKVSRRFGDKLVLDGLDLRIAGGEFVALLGPSGCGKSTALNCLAGLLPLSGGGIWLDERRVDTLPPERRGFGMVFQNYALFPHMSVRRNVGFGLRMRGIARQEARARVDEALRLVQLAPYADRLPGQLSGGQQQRVAIARAIVIEPPLVLMDEPLSNLDAALRLDMRTEIRRLHQSLGLTTVYVTHDQEEALSLADRLVVLREGVVQQVGTPEELYRSPANPYVAGFMGYRNLFAMTVTGGEGGHATARGLGIELTGVAGEGVGSGPATVAIRPEDFLVGEPPADAENVIEVGVEVVEYHGRELAVQARLPEGQALRLRTSTRVERGETVRVWVPKDRVLIFADATAISPQPGPPQSGAPDATGSGQETAAEASAS
ncbi:ABC transporter ATP-binding protein [Rugosimonospora africana]|uniref:ABC transporter ATP-binding protein n=1 Tax=Rugosimonospora africana TaxID=556532 RepID=A0A8J3R110_9ACTN|nr:ABC transporter ATP-binding protein [Rugosimonospora africana]GIH21049.1 ABC transporter ATP-binding protein [Rugosimonospora africana]